MPGCCGDMKFRQRMAYIGVVLYIAASTLAFYYVFEISNAFNVYALDHLHTYHTQDAHQGEKTNAIIRTVSHIVDIPKPVLVALVSLIYLQIFFMLIACTKQEPRFSFAYAWPWYLYNKLCCRNPNFGSVEIKASTMEKVVTLAA
ncbi:lysosomal enzyme trafficking factor-like [Watersipora subatra]|uniref:lysosomal enzyme trafficking factor-like n=1 Tax=Watersipora subatra TaxID=2589382 RepID=UPI00355C7D54